MMARSWSSLRRADEIESFIYPSGFDAAQVGRGFESDQ
jgi:hypothetical protein